MVTSHTADEAPQENSEGQTATTRNRCEDFGPRMCALPKRERPARAGDTLSRRIPNWVAVKELNLSYHNPKTISYLLHIHVMVTEFKFPNSNSD